MKNYVRYNFNWNLDATGKPRYEILGAINDAVQDVGFALRRFANWKEDGNISIRFPLTQPEDIARIADFDKKVEAFSKKFEKYGFTWMDYTGKLRQPRVLKDEKGVIYASSDVVASVVRQRQQKVEMAYHNQSAGVRFNIVVTDWVVIGEGSQVRDKSAMLRDFFRRRIAKGHTTGEFVIDNHPELHHDQVAIFGMDANGNMVPVLTPRLPYKMDVEHLNTYLQKRNFLPLGKVEFN